MEIIRKYFSLDNVKVISREKELFEMSTASKVSLRNIINYCEPRLQGYKYYQLATFVQQHPHFESFVKKF